MHTQGERDSTLSAYLRDCASLYLGEHIVSLCQAGNTSVLQLLKEGRLLSLSLPMPLSLAITHTHTHSPSFTRPLTDSLSLCQAGNTSVRP
jgi:hypothetical protein